MVNRAENFEKHILFINNIPLYVRGKYKYLTINIYIKVDFKQISLQHLLAGWSYSIEILLLYSM